jgi:hypothetical protein
MTVQETSISLTNLNTPPAPSATKYFQQEWAKISITTIQAAIWLPFLSVAVVAGAMAPWFIEATSRLFQ